jgi:hypothetical protein
MKEGRKGVKKGEGRTSERVLRKEGREEQKKGGKQKVKGEG